MLKSNTEKEMGIVPSSPTSSERSREGLRHRSRSAVALLAMSLAFCALSSLSCEGGSAGAATGSPRESTGASQEVDAPVARSTVAALGRLEPGDGVIDIGAPPGERVSKLEVRENQDVEEGQVLAYLDSHATRRAERDLQRSRVEEARLRVRTAEESGPLAVQAQEATARRLEMELEQASNELARSRKLSQERAVTDQELDRQQTLTELAREAVAQARVVLERERKMQDFAALEARSHLATAEASLRVAEEAFRLSMVAAPVAGRVLHVHVQEGEPITQGTLLQLGEIDRMYAVAEVYETDVPLVRPGQRAVITSPALPGPIEGTVELVGQTIRKNDVLGIDPVASRDQRVVEVRIRLDESEAASKLIHLQVDVKIDTAS